MKKGRVIFLVMFFVFLSMGWCLVQGDVAQRNIKGKITEIAEDESYIMLDDLKILVPEYFLADSYLEIGDSVEITVEDTELGLKALDYSYVFEDDGSIYIVEEDFSAYEQDPFGDSEEEVSEEDFSY